MWKVVCGHQESPSYSYTWLARTELRMESNGREASSGGKKPEPEWCANGMKIQTGNRELVFEHEVTGKRLLKMIVKVAQSCWGARGSAIKDAIGRHLELLANYYFLSFSRFLRSIMIFYVIFHCHGVFSLSISACGTLTELHYSWRLVSSMELLK